METKFTKGPWYQVSNAVWTGDERMKENNGYVICDCYGSDTKDNMNIIAACPDLFAACKAGLDAETNKEIEAAKMLMFKAINASLGIKGE